MKYIDVTTGCWRICCRTIYICNPFNCYSSFSYVYNGNNGFVFTLDPSLVGATNVSWSDHTGSVTIPNATATTSQPYPVPSPCAERVISVRYFYNGVWYICCRTILLCNPFDCGSITLNYVANQGYTFTLAQATGLQNISWQVDQTGQSLGDNISTSQPLPVPAPGNCVLRTVSVRYFVPGSNCWRICCLTFWLCNPNDCSTTISPTYGQNGSTTLQVNPTYQQVQWFNGTTAIGNPNTNPLVTTFQPGSSPTVYVRYYDPGSGCYYYCCRTLNIPPPNPGCQLTADFNYTVAGNTVTFTNTSTGSPAYTASAWTFTSGSTTLTSTQTNPVQSLAPGTWNCCLTVSNSSCSSQQECESVVMPSANTIQFDIDDNICGTMGQIIDVPIRVSNFTNVLNFQFSVKLNSTAIGQLVEIIPANLSGSAIASDDNVSVGSMLWSDGNPLSLSDGSIIGTIRIQLNGTNGQTSTISFIDSPTPIYAEVSVNGNSVGVTPAMNGGSICVSSSIQLCGKIKREDDAPIPNVTVTLTGGASPQTTTTDSQGNYCFQNLNAGSNYVVTPKRDINYTNNVNVGDLSKIQRHILNLEPLNSPYKRIAANAKPSNIGINVGDLSEIQKLILGIINDFPEVDSWRFVPKSFVFPNPQNPFASVFPEDISLNSVSSSASDLDFTGIKMGDVTLTNPPGLVASNGTTVSDGTSIALSFFMNNVTVQTGNFIDIPVKANGFQNMTGVQFSLGWDATKLEFQSITAMNSTLGLNATNFNQVLTAQGKLGFTWFNGAGSSLSDGSILFTLRFKAVGNPGGTAISFSDDPTPPYYVDINNEVQASTVNSQVAITPNCGVSGPNSVTVTNNGNGTATATVQGGTAPYAYQWSNGQTTQTATGLITGSYTVTATDANGCSATGSTTIGPAQPCLNWVAPSPTTGWINFNQDFGGAPCNDGTGCPFYEIDAFSVWASEAYEIDGFIQGGTYAFSMCNGTGAGSWIPEFTIIAPNGAVDKSGLGDGDGCTITWTASQSGTYLIVINEAGHCGGGSNLSTDNGWPAITCISNANCIPSCATLAIASVVNNGNGTATVNATGGAQPYSYAWSNGQTTKTATGLTAGTYTVTVTDANGCTVQGSIIITVSSSHEIAILDKLDISPNPSNGFFNVKIQLSELAQTQVDVYNATGHLIQTTTALSASPSFSFDLRDRPAGLYFLKIMVGDKYLTRRIVIAD